MDRIVVGVDRSEGAGAALRFAVRLVNRIETVTHHSGPHVLAVAVSGLTGAEEPLDEIIFEHGALGEVIDMAVREAADRGVHLDTLTADGEPGRALVRLAAQRHADLLVVGARSDSGFARSRIGSVAHHLARRSTCPVALVPYGGWPAPRRRVLAVDGTAGARAAVAWCATTAAQLGAAVTGVTVCHRPHDIPSDAAHEDFQRVQRAHYDWTAPLRSADIEMHAELSHAPSVACALLDAARRTDARLIVIGTHDEPERLGDTTTQLMHDLHVPLILVPTNGG